MSPDKCHKEHQISTMTRYALRGSGASCYVTIYILQSCNVIRFIFTFRLECGQL